MKLIYIFIGLILIQYFELHSQKSLRTIKPLSFQYQSQTYPLTPEANIDEILMPFINRDSLIKDDEENYKLQPDIPFRFGYTFDVNINLENSGTWDELENGGRLWRLKIICPDAYSINLTYNKFELPENSYFFLYNLTRNYILGAFSSFNNKSHRKFATDLTPGELVYLEYYEPMEVKGKGIIEISKIIHGYIDLFHYKENTRQVKDNKIDNILQSGACNRNVNCPEGDDWCREKYAVSRLVMQGWLCSGSLINNTREDYTPYYLTANHCLGVDPDLWIFEFGYMYERCDGGLTLTVVSYSGADLRSNWATSDFALAELEDQPISGEADNFPDVFFNGWDRTGDVPDNTTCIHHPAGDRMKISLDDDQPQIIEGNNYWNCDWESGTTEGGSSGAPLYDIQRRVIGQVSHGHYPPNVSDPCHPDKTTCFGRLSISWNGGGTAETRLRDWLDPDNTGANTLDGIHLPSNIYGHVYSSGTHNFNAYDQLNIGSGVHSSTTYPFRVESGVTMNLRAGREIVLRPCTQIMYGSDFHAFIEEIDCDDDIIHSDRDDMYASGCGSYTPKAIENDIPYNKNNSYINLSIYPNPVTNIARIEYYIPSESSSQINLTNIYGEAVKTLKEKSNENIGSYSLDFDVSALPSGIYFLTLKSGGEAVTKQFAVVR